ncbi:hypothetical protein BpHYR1_040427 [Brachionus plicatilis]|uniref:Uncharacterized protein n=1 Tax=Brachionus plicatilis TaxID=10195 RepID=A0A3M7RL07_BRAPC|nr:hypothetical protein BpHYR1_040427 [Brachionus plicatilis]
MCGHLLAIRYLKECNEFVNKPKSDGQKKAAKLFVIWEQSSLDDTMCLGGKNGYLWEEKN